MSGIFFLLASGGETNGAQKIVGFLPIIVFIVILFLLVRRQFSSASDMPNSTGGFSWRGVILPAIAFVLIGLAMVFRNPGKPSETDRDHVVGVMKTMYAAATNDDLDLWHTVAAPDFYAFDNGKRFEGDALMELIKTLHGQGRTYRWQVTEAEVHIDGSTAWITFVNKGSVQDATGSKNMTWLESAVLRRESDRWRIQFFHSTRVPE